VFSQEEELVEWYVCRGIGAVEDRQEPRMRPGGERGRAVLGRGAL